MSRLRARPSAGEQAAEQFHVPLLRHDFPIPSHIWTFEGAVYARYLQDKVSPKLADEFRSDVFHAQAAISSKDDLRQFTQRWLQQHGQKMPSMVDPTGALAAKVQADFDLGRRLNVTHTPTIVVVIEKQLPGCMRNGRSNRPHATRPHPARCNLRRREQHRGLGPRDE